MGYLSVSEVAVLWGISERSVRNYCAQGRVPGAFRTGKTWAIPADASKPARANAKAPAYKNVPSCENMSARNPLLKRLRDEKASKMRGGIYHKVQVELAFNSNHIEGSKLSLDQTRLIFETATIGFEGEPVRLDDVVETSNHFRAVDFIIDNAGEPLTERFVKELHRILKSGTTDERIDWFNVGEYKGLPSEVAGAKTVLPQDVPRAMRDLLTSYGPDAAHDFGDIVGFHVAFERIHPFQDGNGRVGRLIMFKECLANGIVPFIIEDGMKAFYYRGLAEWDNERGFLMDTCLAAQDRFRAALEYFRIS